MPKRQTRRLKDMKHQQAELRRAKEASLEELLKGLLSALNDSFPKLIRTFLFFRKRSLPSRNEGQRNEGALQRDRTVGAGSRNV